MVAGLGHLGSERVEHQIEILPMVTFSVDGHRARGVRVGVAAHALWMGALV